MPEGPEIRHLFETVVLPSFKGKVIEKVEGLSLKYIRKEWGNKEDKFNTTLPSKVVDIGRKGKYIWIELGNGNVIGFSFGLRGYITNNQNTEYQRVRFKLKNRKRYVYYDDMMNYGSVMLITKEENIKKINGLGDDIYDMNYDNFIERMRNPVYKDKQIVIPLMNQKVVSGVGNYIKSEVLHRSGIYPLTKTKNITDRKMKILFNNIRLFSKKAYTYIKEKRIFLNLFSVYRQEYDSFGNKVKKTKTDDGRYSYYIINKE
jgi:endonuclease-8